MIIHKTALCATSFIFNKLYDKTNTLNPCPKYIPSCGLEEKGEYKYKKAIQLSIFSLLTYKILDDAFSILNANGVSNGINKLSTKSYTPSAASTVQNIAIHLSTHSRNNEAIMF